MKNWFEYNGNQLNLFGIKKDAESKPALKSLITFHVLLEENLF